MTPRRPDWVVRYLRAVALKEAAPVSFGFHDCCLSVCDLVWAMTGEDLASGIRGYRGRAAGLEILRERGGIETLVERVAKERGIDEIEPAVATRGDVVIARPAEGLPLRTVSLGIVDLDGRHLRFVASVGWQLIARSAAVRAWRIV